MCVSCAYVTLSPNEQATPKVAGQGPDQSDSGPFDVQRAPPHLLSQAGGMADRQGVDMSKRKPIRVVERHSSDLTDPDRDRSVEVVPPATLTALSRALGSCVYFIRCSDGAIKIGTTTDLASRKRAFGSGWQHILAVVPGEHGDESALHARFAQHLRRGHEYFDPAPELMEHINEIRTRFGVQPVSA